MKKIYLAKIPSNYDLSTLLNRLPAVRKDYLDSITDHKRKAQSLFVWLLLEMGLKKDFSQNQIKYDFFCNSAGKWFCFYKKISFSLSHSGEYLAVSICDDGNTGIDIEFVSDKILGAKNYLMKNVKCVESNLQQDKPLYLTKIWTEKECQFKSENANIIKTVILPLNSQQLSLSVAFSSEFNFDDIFEIVDLNLFY